MNAHWWHRFSGASVNTSFTHSLKTDDSVTDTKSANTIKKAGLSHTR